MKSIVYLLAFTGACLSTALAADNSAKFSNVHMCCKGCSNAAEKAAAAVPGATATADPDAGMIVISAPDEATLQKAADAVAAAGLFGKNADGKIQMRANTGAKDKTVQTLKIQGVHLCCGECVDALDQAVKSVPGVKAHTATKKASSFEVTGKFNDKAVFEAIQKAGLSGTVAK